MNIEIEATTTPDNRCKGPYESLDLATAFRSIERGTTRVARLVLSQAEQIAARQVNADEAEALAKYADRLPLTHPSTRQARREQTAREYVAAMKALFEQRDASAVPSLHSATVA